MTEDELRRRLDGKTTEELVALLRDHDTEEWRPEVFPLAESILRSRGIEPPEPSVRRTGEGDLRCETCGTERPVTAFPVEALALGRKVCRSCYVRPVAQAAATPQLEKAGAPLWWNRVSAGVVLAVILNAMFLVAVAVSKVDDDPYLIGLPVVQLLYLAPVWLLCRWARARPLAKGLAWGGCFVGILWLSACVLLVVSLTNLN